MHPQGEAQSVYQTIKLAVFQYDIFEGDSKGVIEALLNLHSTPLVFTF